MFCGIADLQCVVQLIDICEIGGLLKLQLLVRKMVSSILQDLPFCVMCSQSSLSYLRETCCLPPGVSNGLNSTCRTQGFEVSLKLK